MLNPATVVMSVRRVGAIAALEQMEKFLQHQQMVQVNSRYWSMVYGNTPEDIQQE